MEAKLIVIGGKANKSEVKLKLPAVIGRSRSADLTVAHPKVSRHHCQIFEQDGLLHVRDNGSLNGTFIDSARVTEGVLKPGDKLTVGPLTFVAVYEPVVAGGAPARPGPLPAVPPSALAAGKKTSAVRTAMSGASAVSPDLATPPPGMSPIPVAVPATAQTRASKPAKKPPKADDNGESMLVDVVPEDDSNASDMSAASEAPPDDETPKAKKGGKIEWLPDVRSDQDDKRSDPGADTVDFSLRKGAGQEQASDIRKAPKLNLTPSADAGGKGSARPAQTRKQAGPLPPSAPPNKRNAASGGEPDGTAEFTPDINPGRGRSVSKVSDDDAMNWLEDEPEAKPVPATNDLQGRAPQPKPQRSDAPPDGATVQFASPLARQDQGFALAPGVEQPSHREEAQEQPSSDEDDLSAFFKTLED